MPNQFETSLKGAGLGAITILGWAGFNVAAKAGIDAGMSPPALSLLRYLIPGFFAIPLLIWLRHRAKGVSLPFSKICTLAVLGGPLFGLIAVAGYQFAPLSYGLLFAPVAVFVTGTFLGAILLKEQVSASRILGALIMFVGLALVVGIQTTGVRDNWFFGVAFFVFAGVMWGAYTVLLRYWRVPVLEGTSAVASLGAVIAAIALGPFAWLSLAETSLSMLATQVVMQGLVGGVLSVVALVAALRHLKAQTAAMLPTFTPAVAMVIAWIALETRPDPMELAGAAVVFLGFAVSTRRSLVWPLKRRSGIAASQALGSL